jgi:hypothetical protein
VSSPSHPGVHCSGVLCCLGLSIPGISRPGSCVRESRRHRCVASSKASPARREVSRTGIKREMLSAGMSLPGVMRLLGHRDYHMTLRYTAITPETVSSEYDAALAQLATKYQLPARLPVAESAPEIGPILDDLSRWLRKHLSSRHSLRALLKRVERLRHDVQRLKPSRKREP